MASSAVPHEEKMYDVFLSFRGEDTRNQFANYLYDALHEKQILTFMDHRLERGDEISPTLRKAIDESLISVVIFSENYATSTWCLDELVQILECKKRNGQIVMPIFYGIDPTSIRKQNGSYEVAFDQLEERFKNRMDKVLQWRAALTEAANLCGLDSKDIRPENKLIQKIVKDILLKLPKYSSWNMDQCKGRLFGIQEHIKQIEELLCFGSTDVRIVGIWGMGGIGKTTLASAVFQRFSYSHFEGRTYLWNVRQEYECFGPNYLRKKLLTDLLKDEGNMVNMDTPFVASPFILDRLRRKKVLIVLDDVDSSIQLDALVEGYHQLAPGSRIIVTTRNKQVLAKVANGIHKVEGLNYIESLKLFHVHAFGKNSLAVDYQTLSTRVASYADGNPLALRVLGSFLHSRSKEEWESALEKLKRVPNKDILKVLRISYEGLDDKAICDIFLDIACFFDYPFTREYAESIIDGGDSSAKIGISVLIDKCLIEICRNDETKLCMHDLIRQMGWSIISNEHKEPGNRSRLCDANDGTSMIEGIVLDMSEIKRDVMVKPTAFSKMCNLRFLKIHCRDHIGRNKSKLYFPQGLDSFVSKELRYFQWDFYPFKSLPSDFTFENLVELILRHSHVKQLGNHLVQFLPKLRKMDLSNSKLLSQIPDLSQAPNLESLNLEGCTNLFRILSSIQDLHKLTHLTLNGCTNLRDLEDMSRSERYLDLVKRGEIKNVLSNIYQLNFTSLSTSIASFITNFPHFSSQTNIAPKFPMNLTVLDLGGNAIEAVPSSIQFLPSLARLDLSLCTNLKRLPTSICKLKSLEWLSLYGCSNLEEFPEILDPMNRLDSLELSRAGIKMLPESIENLIGLKLLRIKGCNDLEFLPNNLCNLSSLDSMFMDNCPKLQTLPPCPLGLQVLSLTNCESLKSIAELPSCIDYLDARDCTSLETISSWTSPPMYKTSKSDWPGRDTLNLSNCSMSHETSLMINNGATLRIFRAMLQKQTGSENELDDQILHSCYPGNEIPNLFTYQSRGNSSINMKLPLYWNSNDDILGVAFCVIIDRSKIEPYTFVDIHYQIDDGQAHKLFDCYVNLGEIDTNSDHVLMWYNLKYVNGRNWISSCKDVDVAEVCFHVCPSFYDRRLRRYVDLGSDDERCKIKKCGTRLVYKKDLEQLAHSHGEDCDVDDESHPTSLLSKRRFDDWKQEDDDDDDQSQPMIDSKKIKLV
ncbi:hypothetical protein FNV43_RR10061 [Rhamnella rubrinervis]|uniref:ADP-ribosyl cyclase/cyclic ADP-ribose hydrolase n=1 Tax=Rhamnella rubrinervis TaxID=2594499 RepID=A0A8K0MKS6_9ROSA|nr:hypothetical protein FNV43_RR10061 [Rhamnella rubrinervis]